MTTRSQLSGIAGTTPLGGGAGLHIEEDAPGEGEAEGGGEGAGEGTEGGKPDKVAAGLQAAVKAERTARQAAEAKLAEITAAQEAAARKAAEEAGEFRSLYEDVNGKLAAATEKLTALQQRESARLEAKTARNTERIAALPESFRGIVLADLDPDTVATQLDKVEQLAQAAEARPAGTLGNPRKADPSKPPPQILAEIADEAARHDKTPEQWFPIWSTTKRGRARMAKLNT